MAWVWDNDAYDYVWQEDAADSSVADYYDVLPDTSGNYQIPGGVYMGTGSSPASGGGTEPVVGPTGTETGGSGFWDTALKAAKAWAGWDDNKDVGTNIGNFLASSKGVSTLGGLAGLAMGLADKRPASGGGVSKAYAGPAQQLTRTIEQGRYGPIAKYSQAPVTTAANGGIMHAYAYAGGGPVAMEDGGFVMTKRAVDGAGGPRGIQQLVPGARMIRGPGNGTSDSIPAFIQGRQGRTPALVSNGEAYVPRQAVQQAGGSRRMYDLMNKLQRRA